MVNTPQTQPTAITLTTPASTSSSAFTPAKDEFGFTQPNASTASIQKTTATAFTGINLDNGGIKINELKNCQNIDRTSEDIEIEIRKIDTQKENTPKAYLYLPEDLKTGQYFIKYDEEGNEEYTYQIAKIENGIIELKSMLTDLIAPYAIEGFAEQLAASDNDWNFYNTLNDTKPLPIPITKIIEERLLLDAELIAAKRAEAPQTPITYLTFLLDSELTTLNNDLVTAHNERNNWLAARSHGKPGFGRFFLAGLKEVSGLDNGRPFWEMATDATIGYKEGYLPQALAHYDTLNVQQQYVYQALQKLNNGTFLGENGVKAFKDKDLIIDLCFEAYPDYPTVEQIIDVATRHLDKAITTTKTIGYADIYNGLKAANLIKSTYLAAPNNKGESVGVFNNQLSLTAAIDLYLRSPDCKIDYKSIATLDADSLTQLKEQILKPENWSKIVSYGPNLVDLFKIDSSAEVKFDEMAFADSSFDAEIARLRNFQNSN
ncbi:MAG: hypothetical protein JW841_05860, partial [Deltaproteobacteria bacterium]|nr:hypothetical protein [Deltaproteobacteria bacterium]